MILDYARGSNYNNRKIPKIYKMEIVMTKTTEELLNELHHTKNIAHYLLHNSSELYSLTLPQYLKELLRRTNRKKSTVIRLSCLNPSYAYQIFSGLKHPTRDKLLAILIAMHLSFDEVQETLKQFSYACLYPRIQRDALIIHAIEQQMNVMQCNILLSNHNEASLI